MISRNSELWLGLLAAQVIVGVQKTVYLTSEKCSQYFPNVKVFPKIRVKISYDEGSLYLAVCVNRVNIISSLPMNSPSWQYVNKFFSVLDSQLISFVFGILNDFRQIQDLRENRREKEIWLVGDIYKAEHIL